MDRPEAHFSISAIGATFGTDVPDALREFAPPEPFTKAVRPRYDVELRFATGAPLYAFIEAPAKRAPSPPARSLTKGALGANLEGPHRWASA